MANQPLPKNTSFGSQRRLGSAKSHEFTLTSSFNNGYRNREDVTNMPAGILIEGSQNVMTAVNGRVGITQGYTLDGDASSVIAPILSSYDWETHTNDIKHLRAGFLTSAGNDGKLQFRYVANAGDYYNGVLTQDQVVWIDLLSNLTSTTINFADYWDTTYVQSHLLFVNGANSIINEWSGGVANVSSATSNSITIKGTKSFAELGFYSNIKNVGTGNTPFNITNPAGTTFRYTYAYCGTASAIAGTNAVTGTNTQFLKTFTIGDQITFGSSEQTRTINNIITDTSLTVDVNYERTVTNDTYHKPSTNFWNPNITATLIPTSLQLIITGIGLNALNRGTFTVTGSGNDYFEISNAAGVVESFKYLGIDSGISYAGSLGNQPGQFIINGTTYTATSGWGGQIALGVTPDPTLDANINNSILFQKPINSSNSGDGLSGFPNTFTCDLIANLKNQIYIGSLTNNSVYISKTNNYKNYNFTAPVRVVGEGAIVTLDVPPTALVPQEDTLYVSSGKNRWYEIAFKMSADLTGESIEIQPLKTTHRQGTQSQALTSKIRNNVVFVSNEPVVSSLGRVSNVVLTPQVSDLSSSIINDMVSYDFTDGSIFYWRNYILLAVPRENLIRVYNMTKDISNQAELVNQNHYWEAPLTIAVSRFSIIDGELYGHSYQSSESYKLFDGYNFNGHPIDARAIFSYQNFGVRTSSKGFNEFYVEGYISPNTTLNLNMDFELDGFAGSTTYPINGSDTQIVLNQSNNNSLGKFPLGSQPLGADTNSVQIQLPYKFREIQTFPKTPFYEYSPSFTSSGVDYNWSILAFGPYVAPTSEGNNAITK